MNYSLKTSTAHLLLIILILVPSQKLSGMEPNAPLPTIPFVMPTAKFTLDFEPKPIIFKPEPMVFETTPFILDAKPLTITPIEFQLKLPTIQKLPPLELLFRIAPQTIRSVLIGGLLLLGTYGIYQLLNADNNPRHKEAGVVAALTAASIICLKCEIL